MNLNCYKSKGGPLQKKMFGCVPLCNATKSLKEAVADPTCAVSNNGRGQCGVHGYSQQW